MEKCKAAAKVGLDNMIETKTAKAKPNAKAHAKAKADGGGLEQAF